MVCGLDHSGSQPFNFTIYVHVGQVTVCSMAYAHVTVTHSV